MNELDQPIQYLIKNESLQIPLDEGLWVIVGILGLIFFILYGICRSRFNNFKKTYVDPFSEKVQKVLINSSNIQSSLWPDFQKNKPAGLSDLEKVKNEIQTALNNTEQVKPLAWNEFYLFTNQKRLSELALFDAKVESLNLYLDSVKSEYNKLNNADLTVKHNHYNIYNQEYKNLCSLTQNWETALSLYKQVLSEIDEAQSAISSAETAEMVDLFSKNKAVSVWSSMENSSAQSEIEDIKPSIEKLVNHLKQLQTQEKIMVQKIEVSDTLDLVSDLFFDFSFDFTSIFSLMSLSSASDSVDQLEKQIKPLGEPINKAVIHHQTVQKEFLSKLP